MSDRPEPRAMTDDEMREKILKQFAGISKYWAEVEPSDPAPGCEPTPSYSVQYRLNGVVHSILAYFEGRTLAGPAFDLIPAPHPDDERFARLHDENWWVAEDVNDGALCHHWGKIKPPDD